LAKIIRKVLRLRLEVPAHDPFGIGLAYARADRGGLSSLDIYFWNRDSRR